MWLTGHPAGPPALVPWDVAGAMHAAAERFSQLTQAIGETVTLDGPALLGERAAHARFGRQGWITVGGAGRMVEAADGWLALQLPRPSDWESLPALLGRPIGEGDWSAVEAGVARRAAAEIERDAVDLGMACTTLDPSRAAEPRRTIPASVDPAWTSRPREAGEAAGPRSLRTLRVLDLSSLWAGPLCADLLARAGAEVTRVEDPSRPDGARRGPKGFYRLLHRSGRDEVLGLATPDGRRRLAALVERSDVVIEASRPRALRQLGIEADRIAPGPLIWVSITGHGRADAPERIGFGDDAAVAGGLWLDGGGGRPGFVGDAIGDPMTGLYAALAVAESVVAGGGHLIDISLRGVARSVASLPVDLDGVEVHGRDGDWWVSSPAGTEPVARPRSRSAV